MSALFGPGLMFCEMVKMDALVRCDENTFRLLDFNKDMHHIGGQLVGSKPELAGECARIIEDLGFDVVAAPGGGLARTDTNHDVCLSLKTCEQHL